MSAPDLLDDLSVRVDSALPPPLIFTVEVIRDYARVSSDKLAKV